MTALPPGSTIGIIGGAPSSCDGDPADALGPLLDRPGVFVHGSNNTGWINGAFHDAYLLAASGVSAFLFDKRGTGMSERTTELPSP